MAPTAAVEMTKRTIEGQRPIFTTFRATGGVGGRHQGVGTRALFMCLMQTGMIYY